MLPDFTHFIFTTIDTQISLRTHHLPQNTYFIKINTDPVVGPKCDPLFLFSHFRPIWGGRKLVGPM